MAFGNDRAEADTALASWYGPGFEGQLTASGEAFDPYGFTAAHNTLPLGTEITVSYAGRVVDVVVNDRGPYSGGRDLDLSQGAAEYLGLTVAGVDYVDYEVAGAAGYAADEGTGYAEAERTEAEDAAVGYDDGFGGEAASGGSYEVQSGDTLTGIAGELGTSVDDLMAANGLTDPDMVYAGQTLAY
ncbi:MAG: septal ring lytic transglycosylase RlpA family protein [Rubrobacteraceae bacterium]|nr:septal ring lytic transglycosylase RlpA family protein [Rubrobacteraceae bacterium]